MVNLEKGNWMERDGVRGMPCSSQDSVDALCLLWYYIAAAAMGMIRVANDRTRETGVH